MKGMAYVRFFILLLCLSWSPTTLTIAQTTPAMELENYKWKNRLLLLFAPSPDNPDYKRQQELLSKEKQGLQDRDLLVLDLTGQAQSHKLREQYQVGAQEFALILLGKDGLEKHRKLEPVAMQEIFQIIDQMPMRQQEMRKQENE